jgi:hypothetical protein
MGIAVDARSVYQESSLRGVSKTLLDLYRNLARVRPGWMFEMFYQVWNGRDPFAGLLNVTRHQVDGKGDRFHAWQHFWLPLSARLSRADVLHCHDAIAPCFSLSQGGPVMLGVSSWAVNTPPPRFTGCSASLSGRSRLFTGGRALFAHWRGGYLLPFAIRRFRVACS